MSDPFVADVLKDVICMAMGWGGCLFCQAIHRMATAGREAMADEARALGRRWASRELEEEAVSQGINPALLELGEVTEDDIAWARRGR